MSRNKCTATRSIVASQNEATGGATEGLLDDIVMLRKHLSATVELVERHEILPRTSDVTAGSKGAEGEPRIRMHEPGIDDYIFARDLMDRLGAEIPRYSAAERERIELNADLRQLSFHLSEELAKINAGTFDREEVARALGFLNRHIVRLRQEFDERRHEQLDAVDLALIMSLGHLAKKTYEEQFASLYDKIGYRRPFIDKFYRDYSIEGVPDGLLCELHAIAQADAYDMYLCVLKGGLTFALLLERFGLSPHKIKHVMCGRSSGSHTRDETMFHPLDFSLDELNNKSVLIIENNIASGLTLKRLVAELYKGSPARMGLFVDYILSRFAGLTSENIAERAGATFSAIHVGPYSVRPEATNLRAWKQALVADIDRCMATADASHSPNASCRDRPKIGSSFNA